jgi:Predicted membrane protein
LVRSPFAAIAAVIAWFVIAPEGALGKLDAIGYAVCHRIDARSFQIDDRQLPLCARCTGEFYAAGLALVFQAIVSGKSSKLPSRGVMAVLFAFFVAFGVDGSNSYLYLLKQTGGDGSPLDQIPNLYIPNQTLRLFTGSGTGIALSAMLYPSHQPNSLASPWMTAPSLEW